MVRGRWTPRPMEGKVKGKEREVKREGEGKEEEEGHRVVEANGHHRLLRERIQGKGSEWRSASRHRQLQTRTKHHATPPPPPPSKPTPHPLSPR